MPKKKTLMTGAASGGVPPVANLSSSAAQGASDETRMGCSPASEELHPELVEHIYESETFGACLHHPLVIQVPYHSALNDMVNRQFEAKRQRLASVLEEGNYQTYVYLHERPYRWDAFASIADRLDNETYWRLLASVYIDSENHHENTDTVREFLVSDRPGREAMMQEDEREAFRALPEVLTIHKGFLDPREEDSEDYFEDDGDSFSFTLDLEIAQWFASRFQGVRPGAPVVQTLQCDKKDALALFTRRGESEILIDPMKVRIVSITR